MSWIPDLICSIILTFSEVAEITTRINEFRDARDWKQFHNPKDMAISVSIEAAELMEQFQWKNDAECEEHLQANREWISWLGGRFMGVKYFTH